MQAGTWRRSSAAPYMKRLGGRMALRSSNHCWRAAAKRGAAVGQPSVNVLQTFACLLSAYTSSWLTMVWYWLTVGFCTTRDAGREFARLSCQALMPMTAAAIRSNARTAATTDAVRPRPNIKEPPFMGCEPPRRTSTRFLRSGGTRVSPTASRSRWRISVSFIGEYLRTQAQALEGSICARLRRLG